MYKNNKTGVPGVHFLSRDSKYRAVVKLNGKPIYLGLFSNLQEAAKRVSDFKKLHQGFFPSVQVSHKNLSVPTLKLFYLMCALDFYSKPDKQFSNLKSFYFCSLDSLNSEIPDAEAKLTNFLNSIPKSDFKIVEAWLTGINFEKLAKRFNYSTSQIARIVIRNLEPLYRKNFKVC